jgi:hypothetical protein
LSIIRRYVGAFGFVNFRVAALIAQPLDCEPETTMSTLPAIPIVLAVAAVGAVIAYAAYRRSARGWTYDMRPELQTELASLHAVVEALPAQIDLAKRSRRAVAHAAGNKAIEGLQQWLSELDVDLSEAQLLRSQLSAADAEQSSSDMDVEIKLVEVLMLSLRANALAEKYRATISAHETDGPVHETDDESLTDDEFTDEADALLVGPSQYSLGKAGRSIVEPAV